LSVITARRTVATTAEAVWSVLAEPVTYPRWVLDLLDVSDADPRWPDPGAAFRYRFRRGPLRRSAQATVLEAHAPNRLRLRWRRGLVIELVTTITIEPAAVGSTIVIAEEIASPAAARGYPAGGLVNGANWVTSLGRLEALARHYAAS
jgi:uncharacterized protein YndB with AHSA1/START domain